MLDEREYKRPHEFTWKPCIASKVDYRAPHRHIIGRAGALVVSERSVAQSNYRNVTSDETLQISLSLDVKWTFTMNSNRKYFAIRRTSCNWITQPITYSHQKTLQFSKIFLKVVKLRNKTYIRDGFINSVKKLEKHENVPCISVFWTLNPFFSKRQFSAGSTFSTFSRNCGVVFFLLVD